MDPPGSATPLDKGGWGDLSQKSDSKNNFAYLLSFY
jgi:hypothetical protein